MNGEINVDFVRGRGKGFSQSRCASLMAVFLKTKWMKSSPATQEKHFK